jgi:hypothetical protein
MHELVDLGHSMTHAVVGSCRDETRRSEHIGISPAEEGWTVANDNEMYLVAALTCNVLQQGRAWHCPRRPHAASSHLRSCIAMYRRYVRRNGKVEGSEP